MYDAVREAARKVAPQIFESMFFTSLVASDHCRRDAPLFFAPPVIQSEIGFQGKYDGKMRLSLPWDLAKKIAINFMGLSDSEIPETQVMDAMGELCNIICGNLFVGSDKKTSYALTIPKTRFVSIKEAGAPASRRGFALGFVAQSHLVRLDIRIDTMSRKGRGHR